MQNTMIQIQCQTHFSDPTEQPATGSRHVQGDQQQNFRPGAKPEVPLLGKRLGRKLGTEPGQLQQGGPEAP